MCPHVCMRACMQGCTNRTHCHTPHMGQPRPTARPGRGGVVVWVGRGTACCTGQACRASAWAFRTGFFACPGRAPNNNTVSAAHLQPARPAAGVLSSTARKSAAPLPSVASCACGPLPQAHLRTVLDSIAVLQKRGPNKVGACGRRFAGNGVAPLGLPEHACFVALPAASSMCTLLVCVCNHGHFRQEAAACCMCR